jgi:streptogramin lyase
MSAGRARRRVRGLVRVTSAAAVLLVVSVWAALPASAGDPLGEIKEFTAGLRPNSEPNRIAAGPDGNLWFTERANPARIGRITTAGTIDEFTVAAHERAAMSA